MDIMTDFAFSLCDETLRTRGGGGHCTRATTRRERERTPARTSISTHRVERVFVFSSVNRAASTHGGVQATAHREKRTP